MFSKQSGIKLESNKEFEKFTNIWKLKNILLNNKWVKEEITVKLESTLTLMKTKIHILKHIGIVTAVLRRKFMPILKRKKDLKSVAKTSTSGH